MSNPRFSRRFKITMEEFHAMGGHIERRDQSMEFTRPLLDLLYQRMEEDAAAYKAKCEDLLRKSVEREIAEYGESSLAPYVERTDP